MQFDYIIIGAGSAGCALAYRLTENGRNSVLLLEAGGNDWNPYIHMPLGYGKTFYDPNVNWMYVAEPDPGLNGQSDHWPRGKVLGGSSSINAMVYVRGHRDDYDAWKAAGNPGWGWDDVLPAYKALENHAHGESEYHGGAGPVIITDPTARVHTLVQPYLDACAANGLPHNLNFNGETQEGAGIYHLTVADGRRMSAARAFLNPAKRRKNFALSLNSLVQSIDFDGNRAVGVTYTKHGMPLKATARREVIVAAGAVASPQILQLNGIGPARILQSYGIKVRVDNPNVGEHLQDHLGLNYTYRMNVPTMNDDLRPLLGKVKQGLKYIFQRKGWLSLSINHGGGFFKTDPALPHPNMQLYMQAFSTLLPRAGERPILSPDPFSGMSLGLSNCRPKARGSIHIKSAKPDDHPRINANAFGHEDDVAEMLLAVKFLRQLANTEPLKQLIAEELRPGPAIQSDAELIHDFKQRSGTVYHPSCTCRMGPDISTSVVDSTLKVHGMDGLRVCDASVFPSLIAGNTNAPAMMVGWRGADFIDLR